MKKNKKRILSTVIVLALLLALCPAFTLAAGSEDYVIDLSDFKNDNWDGELSAGGWSFSRYPDVSGSKFVFDIIDDVTIIGSAVFEDSSLIQLNLYYNSTVTWDNAVLYGMRNRDCLLYIPNGSGNFVMDGGCIVNRGDNSKAITIGTILDVTMNDCAVLAYNSDVALVADCSNTINGDVLIIAWDQEEWLNSGGDPDEYLSVLPADLLNDLIELPSDLSDLPTVGDYIACGILPNSADCAVAYRSGVNEGVIRFRIDSVYDDLIDKVEDIIGMAQIGVMLAHPDSLIIQVIIGTFGIYEYAMKDGKTPEAFNEAIGDIVDSLQNSAEQAQWEAFITDEAAHLAAYFNGTLKELTVEAITPLILVTVDKYMPIINQFFRQEAFDFAYAYVDLLLLGEYKMELVVSSGALSAEALQELTDEIEAIFTSPELNSVTGLIDEGYIDEATAIIQDAAQALRLIYMSFGLIVPPGAVQNFQAAAGNGSVALSWNAPADDGGDIAISFEVSKDNGATWVSASGSTGHTFTGLSNGVSYSFKVRAVNFAGAGTESSVSATPTGGSSNSGNPAQKDETTEDEDNPDDKLPSDGGQTADEWENPFSDLKTDDWFFDDIKFVVENGFFKGMDDGTFSPDELATRAMIITVLARLAGVDTEGGESWFSLAVEWGVENGITDGLNLNDNVTREQLITMLWRFFGEPASDGSISGFADSGDINSWAEAAMNWACSIGLINGYPDGTLQPQGNATRAEIAAIIHRFAEYLGTQ